MAKTVVGLFPSFSVANAVKSKLLAGGVPSNNIQVMANDDAALSGSSAPSTSQGVAAGTTTSAAGVGEKIGGFFRSLSGGDEYAHDHYATGVNAGKALLTVTTTDEEASSTAAMMREEGALDISAEKLASAPSRSAVSTEGTAESVAGETAIPVVEEQLVVGKREVDRGGVRIYSHLVERPVEAQVVLHDERINVERRTVDRPATAADFQGGSYELRATGEEAVVGKTSRVVEEVRLGQEGSDRVEEVHDTVRKTEVEVEQVAGKLDTATPEQYGKKLSQ